MKNQKVSIKSTQQTVTIPLTQNDIEVILRDVVMGREERVVWEMEDNEGNGVELVFIAE